MVEVTKLRDNLWLTYSNPKGIDEDVRGAVVVGSQRTVVWDTLFHPDDMQPVRELIGDSAFHVVYSHADYDHCWGTNGLPAVSGEIIAHHKCAKRFQKEVPGTLRRKRDKMAWFEAVELMPPTLTFDNTLSFDLGDVTLELHHLPGHTLDCIVGFIPQWGVLLAGDTIETPLPLVSKNSPVDDWLNHLERWADDTRVETVVLAHGGVGTRETVRYNIDYISALRAGKHVDLPDDLPAFYKRAHGRNQKRVEQT